MTAQKSLLDDKEVKRAQVGPRQMKDPRSREYAIQTLHSLKRYLSSKEVDEKRIKEELDDIKANRHWEVLGYASMDEYLKIETGYTATEILGQARKMVIQAVCARAEEMGPIDNGGDRRSEKARNQFDNSKTETKGGNDQTYLARKIMTDSPETFDRLKQGEYRSVRAAAMDCGIVKERKVKAIPVDTPDAAIRALLRVFTVTDLAQALGKAAEVSPPS